MQIHDTGVARGMSSAWAKCNAGKRRVSVHADSKICCPEFLGREGNNRWNRRDRYLQRDSSRIPRVDFQMDSHLLHHASRISVHALELIDRR